MALLCKKLVHLSGLFEPDLTMQTTEFLTAWHESDYVRDTKIVRITPAIAKDLLDRNFQNRNVKRSLVQKIKQEILKGRWEVTHQPIAIDEENNLIDGQHRLSAIVLSGATVNVRVTLNCKRQTMNVVDTGKSRNNADMLVMDNFKNSTHTAASLRQVICYQKHQNQYWNDRNIIVTSLDIKEKINEFEDLDVEVEEAVKNGQIYAKKFKPLMSTVTTSFILLAAYKNVNNYLIHDYLEKLATGTFLSNDNPLQILRNRWINATLQQYPHSMISQIKLAEMIYVFNLFVKNQTIKRMPKITLTPMPDFE